MALCSDVLQRLYRLITVLGPQAPHPGDPRRCPQVHDALLLGLCLPCFGVLETRLYDAIMSRLESYPQGAGANGAQCSHTERPEQATECDHL